MTERHLQIRLVLEDFGQYGISGIYGVSQLNQVFSNGNEDYLILINTDASEERQLEALCHEMIHIWRKDHFPALYGQKVSVDTLEVVCHELTAQVVEALKAGGAI